MSQEVTYLVDAIRSAVQSRLVDVRVSIPAVVTKFYPADQTADVQPSLRRKLPDGSLVNLPVVNRAPVQYPRTARGGVKFPLFPGDQVTLLISDRSLDVWKSKGGLVDPAEGRMFNLSDAQVIPGVFAPAEAEEGFPDADMIVEWGSSRLRLKEDGTMGLGAVGGEELLTILKDLADACADIKTTVDGFPTPPNNAGDFSAIAGRLAALIGGL